MSLLWPLRKWIDPTAYVEEEERRRQREAPEAQKSRTGMDPLPPVHIPDSDKVYICRLCSYTSTDPSFCPKCLAGTMKPHGGNKANVGIAEWPRLRIWILLVLAGLVGVVAGVPLFSQMLHHLVGNRGGQLFKILLIAQMFQTAVLVAMFAAIGVALAPKFGFDAPLFRAAARRQPVRAHPLVRSSIESIALGSIVGAIVFGAVVIFRAQLAKDFPSPPWRFGWRTGLTSSLYAGITEELIMRWGILTALAVAITKARFSRSAAFWTANGLAAFLFALAHLPNHRLLAGSALTPAAAKTYVIGTNWIAGMVFGYLYRRRGLEAAMLAHATTDVCLHVAFPAFITFS